MMTNDVAWKYPRCSSERRENNEKKTHKTSIMSSLSVRTASSSREKESDILSIGEELLVLKEHRSKRDINSLWTAGVLLLTVVVLCCLGIGLGLGLFFIYRQKEKAAIADKFALVTRANVDILTGRIDLLVKGAANVRAYLSLGYDSNYTKSSSFDDFLTFTNDPEANLLSIVRNWDYARLVTDEERDRFEQDMRKIIPGFFIFDLDANGKKVVAPRRNNYIPIIYINPIQENLFIFGFDLLYDPLRSIPVIKSSLTGRSSLSSRIRLFSDETFGELLITPMISERSIGFNEPSVAEKMVGCLISVLQIRNIVEGTMGELLTHKLAEIRLFDVTENNDNLRILYSSRSEEEFGNYSQADVTKICTGSFSFFQNITVTDRQWFVCFKATSRFIASNDDTRKAVSIVCTFVGALICITAAVLVFFKVRSTQKVHKRLKHKVVLLEQIIPKRYVDRIIAGEHNIAELQPNVSILFMDIVGFTSFTSAVSPKDFIEFLNDIFSDIDALIDKYRLEKIKTIGDCYMITSAIGGINTDDDIKRHACQITDFAFEAIALSQKTLMGDKTAELRVGIHIGDAICGVIGKSKFAYDLWGNSINFASRMESTGVPMRVHVSSEFYQVIQYDYECEERGPIDVKGKGIFTTYFVNQRVTREQTSRSQ